ncbi:MAG: hypothetical protein HQ518_32690 [Rhodopirellula sp.]|nr:hypothetical protein [Rhodopirellula sp.]
MQKGFLHTAIRITAIAAMIVVTLCVASFGLSKLHSPAEKLAADSDVQSDSDPLKQTDPPRESTGPDPLVEHLDRLGERFEELVSTVSQERSTQTEIARLADSMQAIRQQSDLSGTKLQQELGNLRVSSEVELRDLNRKIETVAEKSQRIEREMIEQRAGILSALENQRTTTASQVAHLEADLDDVQTELSEIRTTSRSMLASVPPATVQPFGPLNPLAPVPTSELENSVNSTASDPAWQEPVILDSSANRQRSASGSQRPTETANATGWKVSPMSHSVPDSEPQRVGDFPQIELHPAPPAESIPATLPALPETSRRAPGPIRAPLKSTLAPQSNRNSRPARVPEIIELPAPVEADNPVVRQISATVQAANQSPTREFDIQTTVIHVAAARPVDVEPAGVHMLNPELSTTAYGLPWTHDAVTHELLRRVSLRTQASIAGRQQATVTSDSTGKLSIGSSCPHCNEVHGFEAGDRLILECGPASDKVQRFHVTSEVASGGAELDSIPEFDLTPLARQTYVITEEAVEGTVEESVATSDEKLVPIHGVLTPVSGPLKTRVSTKLMQRLVVMTFRQRNVEGRTDSIAGAPSSLTVRRIVPPGPQVLPSDKPARQMVVRTLTPVKNYPVFLPPPAPVSTTAFKITQDNSNIEFVTPDMENSFPAVKQTSHQKSDDYCEICERKHNESDESASVADQSAMKKHDNLLLNWFRRVRGESDDSESNVTNADFQTGEQEIEKAKPERDSKPRQSRYVTKPGNRRAAR